MTISNITMQLHLPYIWRWST